MKTLQKMAVAGLMALGSMYGCSRSAGAFGRTDAAIQALPNEARADNYERVNIKLRDAYERLGTLADKVPRLQVKLAKVTIDDAVEELGDSNDLDDKLRAVSASLPDGSQRMYEKQLFKDQREKLLNVNSDIIKLWQQERDQTPKNMRRSGITYFLLMAGAFVSSIAASMVSLGHLRDYREERYWKKRREKMYSEEHNQDNKL